MKKWENLRLVLGYLPEVDQLPDTAVMWGLLHRVAVVLNDSAAPHSQLYWDLVDAFVEILGPDSVTFELDADKTLVFTSVSLMRDYVDGNANVGSPFQRATFYVRGRVHAFINLEPWAAVGGPFPYHDSWTFAIYRETDDATRLRDTCYQVCTKHGWPVEEELRGLAAPRDAPWWRQMVQWLLRWKGEGKRG